VADRHGWDLKYHETPYDRHPSTFLVEVLASLPKGRALDIATGSGANAVFLAEKGFDVEALDWSIFALRQLRSRRPGVGCIACDLTRYPLPRDRYDVVVCFRFLDRALWPHFSNALRTGGALVYETFTLRHREQLPDFPSKYCLEEGELRGAFAPNLRLERYRESASPALASLLAFRESRVVRRGTTEDARRTRTSVARK
jgi:tellurite methyltransferase